MIRVLVATALGGLGCTVCGFAFGPNAALLGLGAWLILLGVNLIDERGRD